MIPAGIEPATFRFVEQRLNNCVTAVPTLPVLVLDSVQKRRTNSSVLNVCVSSFVSFHFEHHLPTNFLVLSDNLLAWDINEQTLVSSLNVWKEVTLFC